jgi:hypothetical protein
MAHRVHCAAIALIAFLSCLPAAAAAAAHPVEAVRLRMTTAANGNIRIALPDAGWSVRVVTIGAFTTEIVASPNGRPAPAASVLALLGVSDMISGYYGGLQKCARVAAQLFGDLRTCEFSNIQHQAQVERRQWSASDGMKALAATAPQYGDYMSNVATQAISSNAATVSFRERVQGASFDYSGIMRMAYPFNPYLSKFESGTPEWISFGFLSGCRANAGELAGFLQTCRAILGSIRYSKALKTELASRAMDAYAKQVQTSAQLTAQGIQSEATREAMIAQFSHQMAQLQTQQQQIIEETNERVDAGWINTLGGQTDLLDPSTNAMYNVTDNYKYYCIDPSGRIFGSDLAADLQGQGCQMLRRQP